MRGTWTHWAKPKTQLEPGSGFSESEFWGVGWVHEARFALSSPTHVVQTRCGSRHPNRKLGGT